MEESDREKNSQFHAIIDKAFILTWLKLVPIGLYVCLYILIIQKVQEVGGAIRHFPQLLPGSSC